MLNEIDKGRLDKVLEILKLKGVRFPVADVVEKTGYKKGHVSNILTGKIGMSENFFNTFLKAYSIDVKKSDEIAVLNAQVKTLTKELARLREIVTKESALDYFLEIEKKMRAELIDSANAS